MSGPFLRPSTAEDFEALYGKAPDHTIRAVTAVVDDKPAGIGGVAYGSAYPLVFSKVTPELRRYPRTILRAAYQIAEMGMKARAVAVQDANEPLVKKLFAALGLKRIGDSTDGEVYAWPIQ